MGDVDRWHDYYTAAISGLASIVGEEADPVGLASKAASFADAALTEFRHRRQTRESPFTEEGDV